MAGYSGRRVLQEIQDQSQVKQLHAVPLGVRIVITVKLYLVTCVPRFWYACTFQ